MVCEKFLDFKEGVGANPCPVCSIANCPEKGFKAPKEIGRYGVKLISSVRKQVERPFSEKLKETREQIKRFANSGNIANSLSFGKDSMALTYLVLQENPRIPTVFENTLIEFPETIYFMRKIVPEWNLNFFELKPQPGVNFFTVNDRAIQKNLRIDDGRKHSNLCCYWLKDKPFLLWRREHGVIKSFTGVTAVEGYHRMQTACHKGTEYFNHKEGLFKIQPLTFWTEKEVWEFTHDEGIPVNPAYQKYGLSRVGCMWCMSHFGWRKQIERINPAMFCYMMRRYCRKRSAGKTYATPALRDPVFQEVSI